MKQVFCNTIIVVLLVYLMMQLLKPCETEGFEGKKAIVNFKEVMYDGKPALLVVDTDASVVQENTAKIEMDGESISSINSVKVGDQQEQEQTQTETGNIITEKVPPTEEDEVPSTLTSGKEESKSEEAKEEPKPVYTASQVTTAFNSAYDHSTCAPFKTFLNDPSLSITDVVISELLPDYEKYDIEPNVDDRLKELNEARGDKLATCRKTFGKVSNAFDGFIKKENLLEYEKKPSGKGCGEYKSISFSIKGKEGEFKKMSEQFDTTEYDEFRNSIIKKENEIMNLVKDKYDTCLIKFVTKPMDKVKILHGRDYIYFNEKKSDVMAGRGRRYAQAWQVKEVLQDDTSESIGALIESSNSRKWKGLNGMCISMDEKDVSLAKCNKDDTNQHFNIEKSEFSDKLDTICHTEKKTNGTPHCLKKKGKNIIVAPLEKTNDFGWTMRKTYR